VLPIVFTCTIPRPRPGAQLVVVSGTGTELETDQWAAGTSCLVWPVCRQHSWCFSSDSSP
jgi:hypothetical protein